MNNMKLHKKHIISLKLDHTIETLEIVPRQDHTKAAPLHTGPCSLERYFSVCDGEATSDGYN